MTKVQQRLIVIVHIAIIFLLYTSPFWLDWRLILLVFALNSLQSMMFGGCVLTIAQLKSTDMSFQEWLLLQLRIRVNRRKFRRFLRWQMPIMLLVVALYWQLLAGFPPLIKL